MIVLLGKNNQMCDEYIIKCIIKASLFVNQKNTIILFYEGRHMTEKSEKPVALKYIIQLENNDCVVRETQSDVQ